MIKSMILDYNRLMEKFKDLAVFQSAEMGLVWDTYTMMPPKGIELRSQQLSLLYLMEHKMRSDAEIGVLLQRIKRSRQIDELNEVQRRNVYLIQKRFEEETKLPDQLVAEIAKQATIATDVWKKAKAIKDYAMFRPELEKVVKLQKKAADILMKVKETKTPYDALIDISEPKMTAEAIVKIFDDLKAGLIKLLKKCEAASRQPDPSVLKPRVPINVQRNLATALAETIGYDVTSKQAGGRIDPTEHPFTSGYYDDVRITTHYYEDNFTHSIFAVLHEAGHALYQQGFKREWMYQPVGSAASSGFHESQSRMLENIVGRSPEFWLYFLPKLKQIAGKTLSGLDLDKFVHAINQVKPSKIRVEADEVTYCLHIIIRFNIERELFADKLTVRELPEAWNQGYHDYLGVKVEDDSEGVMQDIHWSSTRGFGHFICYALGNIYGGQMLMAMEKTLPDWRGQVARGNFNGIKDWLTRKVYSQGNLYDPADLIKKITGKELDVKPYLNYLNTKYSELYGF